MKDMIDRWGERTVCRVETTNDHGGGLELILRQMGDFKNVSRDDVVLFLEQVIQGLYGYKSGLKGNIRTVSHGNSNKPKKLVSFSEERKNNIKAAVQSLYDRLNLDGKKELKSELQKLINDL